MYIEYTMMYTVYTIYIITYSYISTVTVYVCVRMYVHPLSPRDRDWIGDVCCLGDKLNDGMAPHSGHRLLFSAL